HGADPGLLMLEVTEGLVIDNPGRTISTMLELARLGVRFSIDDFGTGYSSLAYLKRLPIHELKIDRSFIRDLPHDGDDAVIVDTIIAMAEHLKLMVVAEGVETEAQAAFLRERGQVIVQGFLYGRPEPAEDWLGRVFAGGGGEKA
ncbi:MAG: EAL domain-containing protein, partial [Pseudomonadota bacterium]